MKCQWCLAWPDDVRLLRGSHHRNDCPMYDPRIIQPGIQRSDVVRNGDVIVLDLKTMTVRVESP